MKMLAIPGRASMLNLSTWTKATLYAVKRINAEVGHMRGEMERQLPAGGLHRRKRAPQTGARHVNAARGFEQPVAEIY
jgi:hypothetical protein